MKIKVGDILPSNNWGDFEVVAVSGSRADIRFLLTGNIKNVRNSIAAKGNVRDTEALAQGGKLLNYECPKKAAAEISAGTLYDSNLWGQVKVLAYRGNKDIDIEFVNTGNVYNVQKDALEKGYVKDTLHSAKQTQDKYDAIAAEKEAARAAEALRIHISKLNMQIKSVQRNFYKACEHKQGQVDKIFYLYATVYEHPRYGEYRIEYVGKDGCTIRFFRTNYLYKCSATQAKSGRVRDYSQFSKEDEREHYRRVNADNYLANREIRLKQAGDWQKANPEKVSIRNRNRRAKRLGAEGTHTKEQTDALMELQDGKCNSCGVCLHTHEKHLDHIMPLDLGGSNWIDNLQWLCQFCNNSKAAKHPDDWAAEILTEHWQARRRQRLEACL